MKKAGIVLLATVAFLFFSALSVSGQIAGAFGPAGLTPARSNWGIGFGARSMSMGGAFIAIADDITAMSHNPAGLSQLLRPEFSFGCSYGGQSVSVPSAFYDWSDIVGYSDTATITPFKVRFSSPSLDYAGGIIPFKLAKIPVVIGFAYQRKFADTANYSYEYTIDENIATGEQYLINITTFMSVKGGTHVFVGSLSLRPFEFLHIGVNINSWRNDSEVHWDDLRIYDYYFNDILQSTSVDIFQTDIYYDVKGGISYDFGLLMKFKRLSAGFVYKTGFKGDYTVNDGAISGVLHWPYGFGMGLAFRPSELLTLTGDFTRTNWSDWGLVRPGGEINEWSPLDSYQVRLGAEYLFFTGGLSIPLRTGWYFNRSNLIDEEGPIASNGLTLGTGLLRNAYKIDLAGVYHFGKTKDAFLVGYTKRGAWGVHLSVSFLFGRD